MPDVQHRGFARTSHSPAVTDAVGNGARFLLKQVRDYPAAPVDGRRTAVLELFDADSDTIREAAARRIMEDIGQVEV